MPSALIDYPATYRDARGLEQTRISNDGATMRMTVRGGEWEGHDFDGLEPSPWMTDLVRRLAAHDARIRGQVVGDELDERSHAMLCDLRELPGPCTR